MLDNKQKLNIGFVGLGKLGLPCALAIEQKGHSVCGFDVNYQIKNILDSKKLPYKEIFADEFLKNHKIDFLSLEEVVEKSDIVFVAVQTPHHILYEGITRIPGTTCDFDYTYLKESVFAISNIVEKLDEDKIVVIISTVLPGTLETQIIPYISNRVKLCYNPFFIAMGTTVYDFYNPEFVLLGQYDKDAADIVEYFYSTIHSAPVYKTSIVNAELIKVSYNTFIGMKITFVNTLMEICHKLGGNVDEVTGALSLATMRLISNKYLSGGMGDGGGCHPRDNIAMSHLAEKLNLSYDLFDKIMTAREEQTEWLSELVDEHRGDLPVVILGKAFKPETNLSVGSPSILLYNILKEKNIPCEIYDPFIDEYRDFTEPALFFIGTKHDLFSCTKFPDGSIVIDPWRYVPQQDNVTVVSVGNPKQEIPLKV